MHFLSRARKGATLVEYGILVGLISTIAIGVVANMGTEVKTSFASTDATLEWYRNGATKDYPARYRFTAQQSIDNSEVIGVDLDGMSGTPFGSLTEATFDELDLRSIQYTRSSGNLDIVLAGNTTTQTPGHKMRCVDLSKGEEALVFDFDAAPGFYYGPFVSTVYSQTFADAPFSLDQELACVIEKK